jgi:hypothetical protein
MLSRFGQILTLSRFSKAVKIGTVKISGFKSALFFEVKILTGVQEKSRPEFSLCCS